jgi:hypothetical protein
MYSEYEMVMANVTKICLAGQMATWKTLIKTVPLQGENETQDLWSMKQEFHPFNHNIQKVMSLNHLSHIYPKQT